MAKHLLIVEDQSALSESLARRFVRRGFKASLAVEIEDISRRLSSSTDPVDLCICDIDLVPGQSGIDVFRRTRAGNIEIPFVFLSGHDESDELMQTALLLGAAAVFSKPTDFSVLLEKICSVLGVTPEEVALAGSK